MVQTTQHNQLEKVMELYLNAYQEAEKTVEISPVTSVIASRRTLEVSLKAVMQKSDDIQGQQPSLMERIHLLKADQSISSEEFAWMQRVIHTGNRAAHGDDEISYDTAKKVVDDLKQLPEVLNRVSVALEESYQTNQASKENEKVQEGWFGKVKKFFGKQKTSETVGNIVEETTSQSKDLQAKLLEAPVPKSQQSMEEAIIPAEIDRTLWYRGEYETLHDFQKMKEHIVERLREAENITKKLGYDATGFNESIQRIESNVFQVVVLGEFSRGKSTFVNALLGDMVLPMDVLPTTATLTMVHYSETPRVILKMKDGSTRNVENEELKEWITALEDQYQENASMVERAEVYWPTEIGRRGCMIIDTPGVNDINETGENITYEFLPKADAAILLLDPTQPLSASETSFLREHIYQADLGKVFYVLNKIDLVESQNRERISGYVKENVRKLTNAKEQSIKVFGLSSRKRLVQKVKNREIEPSYKIPFEQFEEAFEQFLLAEKGALLLKQAIKRSNEVIETTMTEVKIQFNHLGDTLESLERRLNDFKQKEHQLLSQKEDIKAQTRQQFESYQNELLKGLSSAMQQRRDSIIRKIESMPQLDHTTVAATIQKEENDLKAWVNQQLYPKISEGIKKINQQISRRFAELNHDFQQYREQQFESMLTIPQVESAFSMPGQFDSQLDGNDLLQVSLPAGVGFLVGSFLLGPIAFFGGLLGSHFIYKKIKQQKEMQTRERLSRNISTEWYYLEEKLRESIEQTLEDSYQMTMENSEQKFVEMINAYNQTLKEMIATKKKSENEILERRESLRTSLADMVSIREEFTHLVQLMEG
ncbi:dynamin family protein [Anoxynatronum sibiricum]|uniref:Dynamin family protein n=1 Tax=Anoxynatronum sibiricum TaxID=210623 RepID=A0ABU9VTC5_9CLOT